MGQTDDRGVCEMFVVNQEEIQKALSIINAKRTEADIKAFNDINKIDYYIKIAEQQNLSVRQLRERIKNKEYERLDEKTKEKLINDEEPRINDLIKNPILIKNSYDYKEISEKILQKLILEDMPSFMKELGEGFSFIDNEYKIKLGDKYNYIDLIILGLIIGFIVIK